MLYICAVRFDVTEKLKKFAIFLLELNKALMSLRLCWWSRHVLVEYQVTSGTLAVPVFVAIIIAILHINDWEFGVSVPISNLNGDFTPPFLTL